MIRIALACLLVANLNAQAQSVLCDVQRYAVHWKPRESVGELGLRIRCPASETADHTVYVKTLADLNAWSDFLRNNQVDIRITSGDRRSFLEVEFIGQPRK